MKRKKKDTGKPDCKRELADLLKNHNGLHSLRNKVVSHATQEARAHALFRIFRLLREAGFRIGPHSLGGRHIQFLMSYWTADPAVEAGLRQRGSTLPVLAEPLSAAYIQQQMSFLRALSDWIGKPGLVEPASSYVSNPDLVHRTINATRDRTWSSANVDAQEVLTAVGKVDPFVALQLEVMLAFGLRRKEAVMFSPMLSEVPAHALPPDASAGEYLAFMRIKRGTKGGRLRYTAIRNDAQRQALQRALAAAPREGMHIGRPGLSLKQALRRFSNVLRRCGVSREKLGVTPHGLRHEFAADLYFELASIAAPIKGGPVGTDPTSMNAAYLEVAHQLGHGRPQISGAYLGARKASRKNDDAVR